MAILTTLEERFEAIENLCNSGSAAFIRRLLRLKDLQCYVYDMLSQEQTAIADQEADEVFNSIQNAVNILEKRAPFGLSAMLQDWESDEKKDACGGCAPTGKSLTGQE